jgi:hypothetical protein
VPQQTTQQGPSKPAKPPWLAPAVVIGVVILLAAIGRKKDEAIENPIVDLMILTFGVFAFAAVFRVLFTHLGAPGAASFFSGGTTTSTSPQEGAL